jgi:hypothetical protein
MLVATGLVCGLGVLFALVPHLATPNAASGSASREKGNAPAGASPLSTNPHAAAVFAASPPSLTLGTPLPPSDPLAATWEALQKSAAINAPFVKFLQPDVESTDEEGNVVTGLALPPALGTVVPVKKGDVLMTLPFGTTVMEAPRLQRTTFLRWIAFPPSEEEVAATSAAPKASASSAADVENPEATGDDTPVSTTTVAADAKRAEHAKLVTAFEKALGATKISSAGRSIAMLALSVLMEQRAAASAGADAALGPWFATFDNNHDDTKTREGAADAPDTTEGGVHSWDAKYDVCFGALGAKYATESRTFPAALQAVVSTACRVAATPEARALFDTSDRDTAELLCGSAVSAAATAADSPLSLAAATAIVGETLRRSLTTSGVVAGIDWLGDAIGQGDAVHMRQNTRTGEIEIVAPVDMPAGTVLGFHHANGALDVTLRRGVFTPISVEALAGQLPPHGDPALQHLCHRHLPALLFGADGQPTTSLLVCFGYLVQNAELMQLKQQQQKIAQQLEAEKKQMASKGQQAAKDDDEDVTVEDTPEIGAAQPPQQQGLSQQVAVLAQQIQAVQRVLLQYAKEPVATLGTNDLLRAKVMANLGQLAVRRIQDLEAVPKQHPHCVLPTEEAVEPATAIASGLEQGTVLFADEGAKAAATTAEKKKAVEQSAPAVVELAAQYRAHAVDVMKMNAGRLLEEVEAIRKKLTSGAAGSAGAASQP